MKKATKIYFSTMQFSIVTELYLDVVKKCQDIETLHKTNNNLKSTPSIEDSLKKLMNLEIESISSNTASVPMESITYCLQPLLAVQVLLNPSTETAVFVNQLLMIQRLKGYTNARLYSEVMRACLMCLHNVTGTVKESQWGAVTFLKVPFILKELHQTTLSSAFLIFSFFSSIQNCPKYQRVRNIYRIIDSIFKDTVLDCNVK